jgi:hypothetical protein
MKRLRRRPVQNRLQNNTLCFPLIIIVICVCVKGTARPPPPKGMHSLGVEGAGEYISYYGYYNSGGDTECTAGSV